MLGQLLAIFECAAESRERERERERERRGDGDSPCHILQAVPENETWQQPLLSSLLSSQLPSALLEPKLFICLIITFVSLDLVVRVCVSLCVCVCVWRTPPPSQVSLPTSRLAPPTAPWLTACQSSCIARPREPRGQPSPGRKVRGLTAWGCERAVHYVGLVRLREKAWEYAFSPNTLPYLAALLPRSVCFPWHVSNTLISLSPCSPLSSSQTIHHFRPFSPRWTCLGQWLGPAAQVHPAGVGQLANQSLPPVRRWYLHLHGQQLQGHRWSFGRSSCLG